MPDERAPERDASVPRREDHAFVRAKSYRRSSPGPAPWSRGSSGLSTAVVATVLAPVAAVITLPRPSFVTSHGEAGVGHLDS